MIDFRYHLISLVAVLLALAIGIIVGSGFIGGPLLDRLERDVDNLSELNEERLARISELESEVEEADAFGRVAGDHLLQGLLPGEQVVVFQFGDSDGTLVDGVKEEIVDAGAEIATEITLSSKFELSTQPTADELALALGSVETRVGALRNEAATKLGEHSAAAAARSEQGDTPSLAAIERLEALLDSLDRPEFIGVQAPDDDPVIPQDASFVVIGGGDEPAAYEPTAFVLALVESLSERGAPTVVAESRDSVWGLVAAVRANVAVRSAVSTIDNGDSTIGRIAAVLALAQAQDGEVGHYGFGPGRSGPIPAPNGS